MAERVERPNHAVAAMLREYADLLSISGGEAFKVRVYEKAARAIAGHDVDVSTLDHAGLTRIPGVGKTIADKTIEFLATGTLASLDRMRANTPTSLRELTAIPSLGPAKAYQLHQRLGVSTVDELAAAIDAGRLDGVRGFGPAGIEKLRAGIEMLRSAGGRVLIDAAFELAHEMIAALARRLPDLRLEHAGSLRRMKESIGDIDILAASDDPEPVMAAFVDLPLVTEVIARGPAKTSVRVLGGQQVDLRVVPPTAWGAAMLYFTGSKEHNVALRQLAISRGQKLSEYGLFTVPAEGEQAARALASETEEQVYAALKLDWIPPTLREDRGEIRAAEQGTLPKLVTIDDIVGDLHTHTDLTDGMASLETMVAAALKRGLAYYAVTDHAPNLVMQRMTDEKMLAQREQLRELAARTPGMALLHGTELNIDPDGNVDWDADFLAGFDVTVASIHSHFQQSSAAQTARLVKACENPYVNVIGHLTTRQIGRRPPIEADFDAVFAAAAATGTAIEVNSFPDRMDLPDDLVFRARRHGVKFSIDTDAHSVRNFDNLRYGVAMAQRGWLTPDDVVNTWPLDRLRAFVAAKRPGV
jgi:DNA polymerase (family X)